MRLSGSHTYSKQPVPKMPPGLVELMEGLTRDVLKNNPVDVYDFCANHMLKLLEIRDGQKQRMLTLEQKISRAQEKVRQRAKERQKKFDKTSQQLTVEVSKRSEVEGGSDVTLVDKVSQEYENVKKNPLKAPIHHERDLEEAYEVEIFHESASNAVAQNRAVNVIQSANIPLTKVVNESNKIRSKELDVDELIDTNASSYGEMYVDNDHEVCLANNTNDHVIKDDINKEVGTEIQKTAKDLSKTDDTIEQLAYKNDDFKCDYQKKFDEDDCNYDKNHVDLATLMPEEKISKLIEFIDHERSYCTINMAINQNITENLCHKVTNFQSVGNDIKLKNNSELALYHIVNEVVNEDKVYKVVCESVDKDDKGHRKFSMTPVENNSETTDEVKNTSDDLHEILEKQVVSPNTTISESVKSKENLNNSNENKLVAANNDKMQENISTDISEALEPDSEIISAERSSSVDESTNEKSNHDNVDIERTKLFENNNKIHNTSMDLETAAITIQKVFRTFLFKNKSSTFDDDTNIEPGEMDINVQKEKSLNLKSMNGNVNKDRRTLGRMDTVLQTVNEEKSLSLSTDDSSTLSSAATIIQAHVRGFLVRNKLNLNKTITNSIPLNSDCRSNISQDGDTIQHKKTVLNIHIVPEGGHYMSRDESLLTSMELLDGSPMSSVNLHPLGYKREPRKQLKREDAIQSVSPPSNNSGKSVDADDIKDVDIMLNDIEKPTSPTTVKEIYKPENHSDGTGLEDVIPSTILIVDNIIVDNVDNSSVENQSGDPHTPNKMNSSMINENNSFDEMDVVTPVSRNDYEAHDGDAETCRTKLLHSGEFHDAVLPTKVSRSDTSVVREFKNVLVYFLMWNNS